jgi:tripartite-type tricarboxylate transporter receptor subunit TctC
MRLAYCIGWAMLVSSMLTSGAALGDDYPVKPIRFVSSEPGGNIDFVARVLGQGLTSSMGQQVIIENRPSGIIAGQTVASATPDGYTLLIESSSFWVGPLLQKTPYDPVKDFSPITLPSNAPFFLFLHPSVPANSVKELIALAKAKPGELNYGSAGAGSSNHLATELFKMMAGVNIVRVPYKGAGPAAIGLVANQVQLMFGSGPLGMSQVKAGRLKLLAVASAGPSALAPGVPTVAASGLPGYEAGSLSGLWVPAKTPKAVIDRLNREVVRVLVSADGKAKLLSSGVEAVGGSPGASAAVIRADMDKWDKVIRATGLGDK